MHTSVLLSLGTILSPRLVCVSLPRLVVAAALLSR